MRFYETLKLWKKVFSNFDSVFWIFIALILFYSLNVLIFSLNSNLSLDIFLTTFFNFYYLIQLSSFISIILIGFLIGVLVSLLIYKIKIIKIKSKEGFFVSIGVFLGLFSSGCASCGIGLVSLLGLGSVFLAIFPLRGFELSILSIFLLTASILNTSSKILNRNACGIKKEKIKLVQQLPRLPKQNENI